ncbi:hypothetical protein HDV00_001699 [Rhizophlyctis rosea]|nr:hypothetical protein HDV00_001699 [Rhizophlyctis rosea]
MLSLPIELVIAILLHIDPILAFRIAVLLAVGYKDPSLRNTLIPKIPSASLSSASKKGQIQLLEWWKAHYEKPAGSEKQGLKTLLQKSVKPIKEASLAGQIDALEWWGQRAIEILCEEWGAAYKQDVKCGLEKGGAAVLQYWRWFNIDDSGVDSFKRWIFDCPLTVLQWWRRQGLDPQKIVYANSHWSTALEVACTRGDVEYLAWWKDQGVEMKCSSDLVGRACREGHIGVLEFWVGVMGEHQFRSRFFEYGFGGELADALCAASEGGHVAVLEWFKEKDPGFGNPIVVKDGKTVVEWWDDEEEKEEGLDLFYNHPLDAASRGGHVEVLEWWKTNSGLKFKPSVRSMVDASLEGHVHVLEWWLRSGLSLEYNEDAIYWASLNGHVGVLEWWLRSGLSLEYNENAMWGASQKGHVGVLEWWLRSGLTLNYDEDAMNSASLKGHVGVLEWWVKSGLELKWSEAAWYGDESEIQAPPEVMEWWDASGLRVTTDRRASADSGTDSIADGN